MNQNTPFLNENQTQVNPPKHLIDHAGIRMGQGLGHSIEAERVTYTGSMVRSHYHTYYELYYLERGSRNHMIGDKVYHTDPGDFVIFAPYVMHHSFADGDETYRRIVLYFNESMVEDPQLLKTVQTMTGLYHPSEELSHRIHSLLNLILETQEEDGPFAQLLEKSFLTQILILIIRNVSKANPPEIRNRIASVIEYIENHYNDEIRLKDLAEHFYVNEYYLCHAFRKYTNCTITQYINTTRIMNAERGILESSRSVTKIGASCGFSSPTHFCRTFKAVTGMTPTQFRKQHRKEDKAK